MRGRTDDPTTVPDPTGPDDNRVVYSLTEAGSEALADTPTPHKPRRGTVCGRWRGNGRVPDMRMSGKWLRDAGFDLGQPYRVDVEDGRLTIEAATN